MEVFLYNSTVCRLCGEENDNGTFLYSCEENNQNLSEVINTYLPVKVSDDGLLPRTICPGCTIQLEATVEFLNLIINGQKIIRELHKRQKEYKKNLNATQEEIITENIVYEVNTSNGVYQVEHAIALQVAGLEKPKRKRGRPPKKQKTSEELAEELARKEPENKSVKLDENNYEFTGKRKRKAPTRYKEAVQGKELEKIFIEEGVIDEESDHDIKPDIPIEPKIPVSREPEIIGHMENSGELIMMVKGKGRGRPKGRMRQLRQECAICGMEFSCAGRYMSHIAQHGPVMYQCGACSAIFSTKLLIDSHQKDLDHSGLNVIPCEKIGEKTDNDQTAAEQTQHHTDAKQHTTEASPVVKAESAVTSSSSLPDLEPQPVIIDVETNNGFLKMPDENRTSSPLEIPSSPSIVDIGVENSDTPTELTTAGTDPAPETSPSKQRLKCNHCDKTFSTRQSKSMHIKAAHQGEKAYACQECGARFAYPRSLALHAISHRRRRGANGFACDLCGKVLNHPSSVVYHKEAEHAGQRFVCGKCGKCFKHRQLLARHQLVHSALRPYTCKTCNASFKTKANMLNHQLLHTGVKNFSCEICKHKFAHKTSLTLHMRWHTGQKPYACQTCGKNFSQKGNLSEHERIHTGEKPFQCNLCPRRFTTSSQHRLHKRRHSLQPTNTNNKAGAGTGTMAGTGTGIPRRTHVCGACGCCFKERWALVKHVRLHHSNKHKKQMHKQVSLLATNNQQAEAGAGAEADELAAQEIQDEDQDEIGERVIFVTYDVDEPDASGFHILDPTQASGLDKDKILTTCELYPGPSLLVPQPELEQLELPHDHLEHAPLDQLHQPLVLDAKEHIPVTDEEGNPLHFTMQDGRQLAITSADGKSLQVITEDGQAIPVEINGYDEVVNPDTVVQPLNTVKNVEATVSTPVTHYFTIV